MSAGDYVLCLDFSYLCCLIIFRRGDVCIVGGGVRNCDGFNFGAIFKGVEFLNKFCGCVVPEKHKRPYVFFWGIVFMVVYGLPTLYARIGVGYWFLCIESDWFFKKSWGVNTLRSIF